MPRLAVAAIQEYFVRENRPFFYCADTVWQAFSHIPLDGWREYLEL